MIIYTQKLESSHVSISSSSNLTVRVFRWGGSFEYKKKNCIFVPSSSSWYRFCIQFNGLAQSFFSFFFLLMPESPCVANRFSIIINIARTAVIHMTERERMNREYHDDAQPHTVLCCCFSFSLKNRTLNTPLE